MRILLSSIILLSLIASACTEKISETLVGSGSPVAQPGQTIDQKGFDSVGMFAVCPVEESEENEMALLRPGRRHLTNDELVIRNCFLVRDAAEAWAAESGGDYPGDPESRNLSGHTLIDFLPGGMHLVNPYDGSKSQPMYLAWGNPGEVDYLSFDDDRCNPSCDPNGYMITGFGEFGEVFQVTHGWPDSLLALDSLTIANCILVRSAAEQFAAENNGVYPLDLAAVTRLGHTLGDFFPGELEWLRNAYTGANTEPVDGEAVNQGETGYLVWMVGDVCRGYRITGYGRNRSLVVIAKEPAVHEAHTTSKIRARAL